MWCLSVVNLNQNDDDGALWWDALAGFLASLALEKNLALNSREAYRRDLTDFIRFCLNSSINDYHAVTTFHITAYLSELHQLGCEPSTINRRLSAFRSFYSYLCREKLCDVNPARVAIGPRLNRNLPDVLTPVEITAMINSTDLSTPAGIRDRAILELMYGCGLRVSETVNTKREHFILEGKLIQIEGKGGSHRIVPVGAMAMDAIAKYLAEARPLFVREKNIAGDYLFLSQKLGKRMTRQAIWLMIKHYANIAGIKSRVTPHTFRHSFATHLLEGGAGLRDVQELVGHVSIDTTMIYTHIDRSHLLEVIKTFHPRDH